MKRVIGGVFLALAVTIGLAGPAGAAIGRLQGTGSYDRLVVNNAAATLTFKLYGPGGKCEVKYLRVEFKDRDGSSYEVDGGCYPGAIWMKSLAKGQDLVNCPGLKLTYNDVVGFWAAQIPRTCMPDLGSDVRVTDSWIDDYSPMINETGPSKWIAQG